MGTKPTPYAIPRFGGLDLREEPDEGGPQSAIDLLNVDFDKRGAIRTRGGYTTQNTVTTGTNLLGGASLGDTGAFVAASSGTVYSWDNTGALIDSNASAGQALPVFVEYNDPTTPTMFVFGATANMSIKIADGDVNAGLTAGVAGLTGTVQPPDNRLVVVPKAGPATRVKFSDAGDPSTFGANNYVDLIQGRGSAVLNLVTWGNQVFAFKQRSFAVFYGNSTDSAGNPVFNYRMVEGKGTPNGQQAAAGADGVYFVSDDGVYKTTGGRPTKISGPLDPHFQNQPSTFFNGGNVPTSFTALGVVGPRVYVGTSSSTTFVYDTNLDVWMFWDSPAVGPVFARSSSAASGRQNPAFANGGFINQFSPGTTTDNAASIVSRYRSSFYSPIGSPSQECTIKESVLAGIGLPQFSVSRDYGSVPTAGGGAKAQVTLGTSPAITQGWHTNDQAGRVFSYQIESTIGPWRVESIVQHITGIRSPGLRTA